MRGLPVTLALKFDPVPEEEPFYSNVKSLALRARFKFRGYAL